MRYVSTRNSNNAVSGPEAILQGIASDGGLFVPEEFPNLSALVGKDLSYEETLEFILSAFFLELDLTNELKNIYKKFETKNCIDYKKLGDRYILELFHGPTCAFKDFALQVLPLLIKKSKEYLKDEKRTLILAATSGDTGKAALEGFANTDGIDTGIDIAVIYPEDGVSQIQKKQMITQLGKNVLVLAMEGNFDDAQNAVKKAFLNQEIKAELEQLNMKLSSANSINIGRLVPQIAYYYFIYNQLLLDGEIKQEEKLSFCVPTGNFGDILAGYYAKRTGLPVDCLISASNENKVLKEFFETGIYDKNRSLILTESPSMDIVVSSNLERLLYHTSSDAFTMLYMDAMEKTGIYAIGEEHRTILEKEGFLGGYAKKEAAARSMEEVYRDFGYVMDTHTAVAWTVADSFEPSSKMVVLSTASPYKFAPSVCDALNIPYGSETEAIENLSNATKTPVPAPILEVLGKEIVHKKTIQKDEFEASIVNWVQNGQFRIKVPATTANIGPGFDAIGIALNLHAEFDVNFESLQAGNLPDKIEFELKGVEEQYKNKENLLIKSYLFASKQIHSKIYPENMTVDIKSDIPISRGLGSSAAFIVAGVAMAYELSKKPYTRQDLLQIATMIEGHPDNVAPAIFGGMVSSIVDHDRAFAEKLVIHDDLNFIALVPDYELSTEESRKVLPKEISFQDAVRNISATAFLIGALQNKDYNLLKIALRDYIHQPYRMKLIRNIDKITEIAEGSLGYYLSGAGPTIMILDKEKDALYYKKKNSDTSLRLYDLKVCFNGTKIVNTTDK